MRVKFIASISTSHGFVKAKIILGFLVITVMFVSIEDTYLHVFNVSFSINELQGLMTNYCLFLQGTNHIAHWTEQFTVFNEILVA